MISVVLFLVGVCVSVIIGVVLANVVVYQHVRGMYPEWSRKDCWHIAVGKVK